MQDKPNFIHSHECKCFTWKPIFAGALIIIGFSFLLNLFSVAIGLTAFTTNSEGIQNIAIGGLIATALGIVVSMFAAGWLTGYLGNRYCTKRHLGALYGFLAWCVALIFLVFLTEYLTKYILFYTHFISGSPITLGTMANTSIQAAASETTEKHAVLGFYIVFWLFFLSAFACSLGGHCGMRRLEKNDKNE